jgi:hypothetical protein
MLSRLIILILFKSQSNVGFVSELLISGAEEFERQMITQQLFAIACSSFPYTRHED